MTLYHVLDRVVSRLSVAFWPVEPFAERTTTRPLVVELAEKPPPGREPVWSHRAVRNPSGVYVATDLADGEWRYRIKPARRGEAVLPVDGELALPLPSPPIERIDLPAAPSFPFPAQWTVVRGRVRRRNDQGQLVPAKNAQVEALGWPRASTRTNELGSFAIAIKQFAGTVGVHIEARSDGSSIQRFTVVTEGTETRVADLDLP